MADFRDFLRPHHEMPQKISLIGIVRYQSKLRKCKFRLLLEIMSKGSD